MTTYIVPVVVHVDAETEELALEAVTQALAFLVADYTVAPKVAGRMEYSTTPEAWAPRPGTRYA